MSTSRWGRCCWPAASSARPWASCCSASSSGIGQIDLVINLAYVILLTSVGALMLFESLRAILRMRWRAGMPRKLHQHTWVHGLPLKMRFRRSRLYISALLPLALGFVIGVLAAIMGVGGAFLMVPAMIYLLGMPTRIVVGTSLFQTIFVTANVTFLQAVQNQHGRRLSSPSCC